MVNIENVFKGGVRKTLLEWAEQQLSPVICLIMATKRKRPELKNRLNADVITAGFARITRINLGIIEVAALQASYAKIHGAIKIPILFLYWDSPEEENRQLDKLHSTHAERAAFVKASQSVLDKHRKELDPKLFAYLGA
jgi:hypothetical protein